MKKITKFIYGFKIFTKQEELKKQQKINHEIHFK